MEMQKCCVIGNAKLFALLEDLISHPQRLRRSTGERDSWSSPKRVCDKAWRAAGTPDPQGGRRKRLVLTQCPGMVWIPDAFRSEFL